MKIRLCEGYGAVIDIGNGTVTVSNGEDTGMRRVRCGNLYR